MKKLSALFILTIFLFNLVGYRFTIEFLQQNSDTQLEALLDDNQYDEADLIEIKIPISLPYQNNWASFERCDGEVEMNGILYKYVKRKLFNDTLHLMCIPNAKKMHLETARIDFFKYANDLAQTRSDKPGNSKPISFKKMLSDYEACSFIFKPYVTFSSTDKYADYSENSLLTAPHISPEQPPDFSFA